MPTALAIALKYFKFEFLLLLKKVFHDYSSHPSRL